jgi:hypothetical protein
LPDESTRIPHHDRRHTGLRIVNVGGQALAMLKNAERRHPDKRFQLLVFVHGTMTFLTMPIID